MKYLKVIIFIYISLFITTGCSGIYYWPDNNIYFDLNGNNIPYENIYLDGESGQLHGWYFPSATDKPTKGMIYFLHGNSQNMSAHFAALHWITRYGWSYFIIDYRGFGSSQGTPNIKGVHEDALTGLLWSIDKAQEQNIPLVLFGQSIGAATAATLIGQVEEANQLSGVILDSPFSNYRLVVKEKAAELWFSWPFQHPISWLMDNQYSPDKYIQKRPNIPLLIMHSCADKVVYCTHGKRLFDLSPQPKIYWEDDESRHIQMLLYTPWRIKLLDWLEKIY